MEIEEKSRSAETSTDLVLQWGNRKRLRCFKVKNRENNRPIKDDDDKLLTAESLLGKKKVTASVDNCVVGKETASPYHHVSKKSISTMNVRKSLVLSPEKEDRYCTRGSLGVDENRSGKLLKDHLKEAKGDFVWPRLFVSLSNKEKEEDFMAMKGCKLPQRPKKRAKLIQKTILLVSPGAWLTDLCQERYEVREKKTSKKKPRGLKALESMESDQHDES